MRNKPRRTEKRSRLQPSERYARLLLGHRPTFAILAFIVSIGALFGLAQLRFDGEPREIFKQSDDDFAKLEEYFEQFGADDNNVILLLRGDLFTPGLSEALRGYVRECESSPRVVSSLSILDVPGPGGQPLLPGPDAEQRVFEEARTAATSHPFATGQIIAESGQAMLVTLQLIEDEPQTIGKIRPIYEELKDIRDKWFQGLPYEAIYAGSVASRVETLVGVRNEFFQITAIGALIAMLIALVLFRSVTTTLIVSAGPAVAVLWTLGLMGWLDLDIEGISTPLPAIVFVVAFANAIHLMIDIRRSRRLGEGSVSATRIAIGHLGLACLLTSLTTTIGFASLTLAGTGSVQRFGLSTAAGSVLGFIANLTVVPLLASIVRSRPHRSTDGVAREQEPRGLLASIAGGIIALSLPLTVVGIAVTGILLWAASQLKSDIVWTESLPEDSEITRAMKIADQEFGGVMQARVVVSWDESISFGDQRVFDLLRELRALTETDPTFSGSLSILNFLPPSVQSLPPPALQRAVSLIPQEVRTRLLRTDLRRTVLTTRIPNSGAAKTRPALTRLQADLDSLQARYPGISLHVTGSAVIAAENMTNIIGDLVRSLSFASITVFIVLTIALRSLTLGLLSIIPNAFPLLFNAGILYHLDKPLQITSVLTFSICLGIAVDDTIHFLIRFLRERRQGANVHVAIKRSFESVGLALLITTAIVSSAFLAAMTSTLPTIVLFGALACSALFAALIGDLVLLPAMIERVVGRTERSERLRLKRLRDTKRL